MHSPNFNSINLTAQSIHLEEAALQRVGGTFRSSNLPSTIGTALMTSKTATIDLPDILLFLIRPPLPASEHVEV